MLVYIDSNDIFCKLKNYCYCPAPIILGIQYLSLSMAHVSWLCMYHTACIDKPLAKSESYIYIDNMKRQYIYQQPQNTWWL